MGLATVREIPMAVACATRPMYVSGFQPDEKSNMDGARYVTDGTDDLRPQTGLDDLTPCGLQHRWGSQNTSIKYCPNSRVLEIPAI